MGDLNPKTTEKGKKESLMKERKKSKGKESLKSKKNSRATSGLKSNEIRGGWESMI